MTKIEELIFNLLDSSRIKAKGTFRSEAAIQLGQVMFDEILNMAIRSINSPIDLKLYLCDSYNTYSAVHPFRIKDGGTLTFLILDQHMDALNRVFNAIFLADGDSGHDIWKLAYELFMEERMVSKDDLMSVYFGMNMVALGNYDCENMFYSKENNFFVFAQMAYIIGHEIGHWIQKKANSADGNEQLNLKDDIRHTRDNIREMLYEIYDSYEKGFREKEYYELIKEHKAMIGDSIVEECTADAFAIAAVFAYVDQLSEEELENLGPEDDVQLVTLRAILIVMMNLQLLAMVKMTLSEQSFENQTAIRLSFFRNYVWQYFEDIPEEMTQELENTVTRYQERITDFALDAFSTLEDRMGTLQNKMIEDSIHVNMKNFMEL